MHLRRLTAAIVLAVTAISTLAQEEIYCSPDRKLTPREGTYVRKDVWEHLPTAKDMSSVMKILDQFDITSVQITASGEFITPTNGWHEGIDSCLKFQAKEKGLLWASKKITSETTEELPNFSRMSWEGPFIRVGPAYAEGRLYLQRIFGTTCFDSKGNLPWCFGPGYISHANKTYTAELILDTTELPNFGFAVEAKEHGASSSLLWIFVRDKQDWLVFKESFDFARLPQSNQPRKPWEILKRNQAR